MGLVQKYLNQPQTVQAQNNFESGFDTIEKQYVVLGSAQTQPQVGNITVRQRLRSQYLRGLFSMSPSANQGAEKIVSCIMSGGWVIRPKDKNKKHNEKKIIDVTKQLDSMGLTATLQHMAWAYYTFGDAFVYTPTGKGAKSKTAVDLVPLDNMGVSIQIQKDLFETSGVLKIKDYTYEVLPLEGNQSSYTHKVVHYAPEEIVRWQRKTAYNLLYGTAPLEEDQATLILGLKVLNHNLRFFANSARPPLIISLGAGADMSKAMEYKKMLDSRYKGSNNVWETMVTWGDTQFKELTMPDTTAFMDMLTYVRIQVCGLLGVPPQEIGVVDKSGLNTAETSHKDFIKTVVNAKKREIGELLTIELLEKRMGIDDMEIYLPPMDAITEKQRAETNRILIESGQMTVNESRETLGKDIINEDWAKVLVYGNLKGVKGITPFSEFEEHDPFTIPTHSNGRDGIDNNAEQQSGRPDLEGRINTTDDSIN
jgi:HK97 family phage portal protein